MRSFDSKTRLLRFVWSAIPWLMVALIVVFIVNMGGRIKEKKTRLERPRRLP